MPNQAMDFDPATIPGELAAIQQRLEDGDKRMSELSERLEENTATTNRIAENISGMLEFLDAAQGAFKVLTWIGKLAKPISYIVGVGAGIIGIWTAIKGGGGIGPR